MNSLVTLRPRRSLAFPLLVFAVPALYFVYRDATLDCPSGGSCFEPVHAGYALAAVAASYLLAVGLLALVDVSALTDRHSYARLALQPTDRTLAVLGVLVTGIVAYFLATLVTTIPSWLDLALTPVGLVVGLPFVVTYAAMQLVGSALSTEPSMPVQIAVVAVSLGATGAWLFALATAGAGLLPFGGEIGIESG